MKGEFESARLAMGIVKQSRTVFRQCNREKKDRKEK